MKKHLLIAVAALSLAACKKDSVVIPPQAATTTTTTKTSTGTTTGTTTVSLTGADFTRYISLGNSLTAGFANGGLYLQSQQTSYPAIMAQQMQKLNGGVFNQPLFDANHANGSGYVTLSGFDANDMPVLTQVTTNLAIRGTTPLPNGGTTNLYTKYTGDVENYGVPGIKLVDITDPSFGNRNGYFERLLPTNAPNANTAYLDFAASKSFTFFSSWLGDNDALGWATAGGASDSLTSKSVFGLDYSALINTLTTKGAKGVLATIPDVTVIPYFNTITVGALFQKARAANAAVKGIYIQATDANGNLVSRLATNNDLISIKLDMTKFDKLMNTSIGTRELYGLSPNAPIENSLVLDANEVAKVRDYINAYNIAIKSAATAKGLALFDAYTFLNTLKSQGMTQNGVSLTATYYTGGVFSLDGIHMTPRGYALIANGFIAAINTQYKLNIAPVDVSTYAAN